jgi:hypothetical protein
MKAQNILDTIGGTPHIRLQRLFAKASQHAGTKQPHVPGDRRRRPASPGQPSRQRAGEGAEAVEDQ